MYTYNAKVLRVVDGDTIDVLIDLGFSTHRKIRIEVWATGENMENPYSIPHYVFDQN